MARIRASSHRPKGTIEPSQTTCFRSMSPQRISSCKKKHAQQLWKKRNRQGGSRIWAVSCDSESNGGSCCRSPVHHCVAWRDFGSRFAGEQHCRGVVRGALLGVSSINNLCFRSRRSVEEHRTSDQFVHLRKHSDQSRWSHRTFSTSQTTCMAS